MVISLLKLRSYKLLLNIENRFITKKIVIPIGYDCHPAYMLKKLNLRKVSLPFDWLNMDPVSGISYVTETIKTNFIYFLGNLKINERGYVVSSRYPCTEFMHEMDLIENPGTKAKLVRRYERFTKIFKEQPCSFLYNISGESLKTKDDVNRFRDAAIEFMKLMKESDELFLYIRYDENYDENKDNCDTLYNSLNSIDKLVIRKYIREKKEFGIWGNEKKYAEFFKSVNTSLRKGFPKVYFTN